MRKRNCLKLLPALAFIVVIQKVSASEIECEEALSNFAMIQCEQRELDRANKELLEELRHLKNRLQPDEQEALDRGQAAWVAYRDAHCDSIVETYAAGSGGPLAGVKCQADLTKDRIKQLRQSFADRLSR
jgi:uncharacterized protein YecT (DUF1311 family)